VNLDDTIVAIATRPGAAGSAWFGLAGPEARAIAAPMLRLSRELEPGRAVRGDLVEPGGAGDDVRETGADIRTSARIDEVVVTFFAKPHSYTTDDVVEISAHARRWCCGTSSNSLLRGVRVLPSRVNSPCAPFLTDAWT